MCKSIKNSQHQIPSKKTRWAYFMQAIGQVSEAINTAFPGYHPQWVIRSQEWRVNSTNFNHIRENMLGITIEQCAAYLRVNASTVRRWEAGSIEVPFTAFELLRLVYESASFRLSHKDWDGWFIGKDGRLVSPDIGRHAMAPWEINLIMQKYSENERLKGENKRLTDELGEAQAENTRLREQFVNQGVVDEIDAMRNHLTDLLSRLNTARVYPFPATTEPQQKEAAA